MVLSVEEIETAIEFWLHEIKQVEIVSPIDFQIEGQETPGDWRAELPLNHVLTGASFEVTCKLC